MEYFIAIDSGGTKTDTVLFDETGHILHRDLSKGCNAMDIGTEEAKRRMWDILQRVEPIAPKPVKAIFGAVAGTDSFGDFLAEYVRPMMKAERMHIEDDGWNLISGALGRVDGCSMVCGTGSSLFVRKDGKLVNSGGRVLGVTSVAPTLQDAINASYEKVNTIHFENAFCRRDIGQRALKALKE